MSKANLTILKKLWVQKKNMGCKKEPVHWIINVFI